MLPNGQGNNLIKDVKSVSHTVVGLTSLAILMQWIEKFKVDVQTRFNNLKAINLIAIVQIIDVLSADISRYFVAFQCNEREVWS